MKSIPMKNFVILILLTILSCNVLNAQWDNDIICPGDSTNCPWLDSLDEKVQLSYKHDQYAYVKYRFRYCNGILEIDITGVSTIDNAGFLKQFNFQHYEFASLRSVVELGVLTHHAQKYKIGHAGQDSLSPYFDCSDTASLVTFYSASCGIFLKCLYERADTSRICSPYFTPPYPEVIEDMVKKVVYTKWQKCGYNCCKRTYKVCRDKSSVPTNLPPDQSENYESDILRILETKITSVTDCSLQSKYGSNPCYTNCWNVPIP
jgi:hypothetical protein